MFQVVIAAARSASLVPDARVEEFLGQDPVVALDLAAVPRGVRADPRMPGGDRGHGPGERGGRLTDSREERLLVTSRWAGRGGGRVHDTSGREIGTVFLEEEFLTRRPERGPGFYRNESVTVPAIHQHYLEPGVRYDDGIIFGEGLEGSERLWGRGLVEIEGEYLPVVWCGEAESREIGRQLVMWGGS